MEPVNCTNSELCTYLQALAAGYWPMCSRDSLPSARSKKIYIASRSFRRGKKTVHFPGFQFLMMFRHLMAYRGAGLLTLSLADSHVKTSALQEKEQESTEKEAECGGTWRELSARFDRATCSWKTHQCLFTEDLPESSVTFPKWGMIRDGVLWEQTTPERRTVESESGFWPTPDCQNHRDGTKLRKDNNLATGGRHGVSLHHAVMWPTPPAHNGNEMDSPAEKLRHTPSLTHQARGGDTTQPKHLNPEWVEWLMGWPIGWTDLKPLATDKFQRWQNLHGKY